MKFLVEIKSNEHNGIIRGFEFKPESIDRCVILIPDISIPHYLYDELAQAMTQSNCAVLCYQMKGQDDPNNLVSFKKDDIIDDVEELIRYAKKQYTQVMITLIGIGIGAHLAVQSYLYHINYIDQIILVAPSHYDLDLKNRLKSKWEAINYPDTVSQYYQLLWKQSQENSFWYSDYLKSIPGYGQLITNQTFEEILSLQSLIKHVDILSSNIVVNMYLILPHCDLLCDQSFDQVIASKLSDIHGYNIEVIHLDNQKHDLAFTQQGAELLLEKIKKK